MSEPVLTAQDALKWFETTSNNWRKLLAANPDILALPCDIATSVTVAQLLQHIVAVELRYAERIARLPETDYDKVPFGSVDAIYATHDRALDIYHQSLAADLDWDQTIDFLTRTYGPARATRKTIFFHAVFHSIRHYAQLGTLIRQHGYTTDWPGDYLFMGLIRH
ncbi:MAG TPA: DinB family protein [Edaphobacter sp.]